MFFFLHPISEFFDFATKLVESHTFPEIRSETFSNIFSEAAVVLGITIGCDFIDAIMPILDPLEVMRAKSSQRHQFIHDSSNTPDISVTKYGIKFDLVFFSCIYEDFKLLLQN